ncbi:FAD-dependent monooxygenase [Streptomyces sp. P17]|uniref:FAD-dependent monooxygenase n=1 Tax=Streptomyces sp. P17 TaxID=3074716 RepID=UPI0028F4524C|nr:FAD-dependent monooxygenase [Streptomyces sp. P17]MDT9698923.1 FAD-dependent monooxygenase [Streptomyces sp. P17]
MTDQNVVVDDEVEVLVVGGGPVGLTARALLERWGVSVLLVEKYRQLSPFPRSRLVNVRSMEIFRRLAIDEKITAAGFAPEYGRIRFRESLPGPDFASAAMVGVHAPVAESPALGVVTSQDRLEPHLLAAASGPLRFGVELTDLTEEADGVVARLLDHERGTTIHVRARCLLAADGANSTVRQLLGIGAVGPGAIADVTTVVFDADLDRWSASQPAGVYVTAHGSIIPLYPEGGWAWFGPTPGKDAERTDWADLIAHTLGTGSEVAVDVRRVQHWVMKAFVAEHFRHGRILLAGDAAHAVPVVGGLGMNAGIADAHNLCWKLAGVLQGWAGPSLLDSYEKERHPVAHRTLRQAVANAELMFQVQARRREQLQSGGAADEQIELPWSEEYFAQLGLVLGIAYDSDAVLTDGSAPHEPSEPGTDYVPSTRPGHRMPHLWLAPDRSTLDILGEWFTLLTPDPAAWEGHATGPWPLHIETLPEEHTEFCGLGPHGALLVRPDGHVAARWHHGPPGDRVLSEALKAITAM